ncbi:hypothetical protein JW710_01075 [Candidatus Dojkabacteria bacterium]|nr:hypothetical protein [Candidatus Dojkabacteria bacterium]
MAEPLESNSKITIHPAVFYRNISIPTNDVFQITVENNNEFPVQISTSTGEFTQDPKTLSNTVIGMDLFNNWFSETSKEIPANTTEKIEVKMDISENTTFEKASYFPTIILHVTAGENSEAVGTNFEYAIPVFLQSLEMIQPDLEIKKLDTEKLSIGQEIEIDTEIQNTGNTYTRPSAYLEFFEVNPLNKDNKTRINTITLNTDQITLLPESILIEKNTWERKSPGYYRAKLHVMIGNKEIDTESSDFWLISQAWLNSLYITAGILLGLIILFIITRKIKLGEKILGGIKRVTQRLFRRRNKK